MKWHSSCQQLEAWVVAPRCVRISWQFVWDRFLSTFFHISHSVKYLIFNCLFSWGPCQRLWSWFWLVSVKNFILQFFICNFWSCLLCSDTGANCRLLTQQCCCLCRLSFVLEAILGKKLSILFPWEPCWLVNVICLFCFASPPLLLFDWSIDWRPWSFQQNLVLYGLRSSIDEIAFAMAKLYMLES